MKKEEILKNFIKQEGGLLLASLNELTYKMQNRNFKEVQKKLVLLKLNFKSFIEEVEKFE